MTLTTFLDERVLGVLLREKADALAQMQLTTERAWPGVMARYLAQCRLRSLHAVAMYTLLNDFTYHIMQLALRRHVPVDLPDSLPVSCIEGGCEQICDRFQRSVVEVFEVAVTWQRTPWDLPRIAAYVEEGCALPLRSKELAAYTGWKPLALLRAFKKHTGMTVHAYLTRARVRRATALLAAGEKVEWVMLQVGYRNRTNFNREFRRIEGCVPGEFKRRCMPYGTNGTKVQY